MMDRFAPGFYTTKAAVDAVAGDWRLAGWAPRIVWCEVEDRGDATKSAVSAISAALGEPAGFGMSVDSLTATLARISEPTVLIWVGGSAFADAHPKAWDAVSGTLTKWTAAGGKFAVVLSGAAASRV